MPITVPFEEHEDSPIESGNRDGEFQFVRVFVVDWSNRWAFLRELFTGGPIGMPMVYSNDWPGVFAESFSIDRIASNPVSATITDPQIHLITHNTKAKITVVYKPMVATEDGTLITYEQQQQGEFVTVPSRGLKWQADGTRLPPDVSAAYPTTTTRHVITWSQVRNPPWQKLSEAINKINSIAFRVPVTGQEFVAGSLLFAERSASVTLNFSGLSTWKLTLTFLEKAQKAWTSTGGAAIGGSTVYGWNWQWRDDTGNFDRPQSVGTNAYTFQETDFRLIFTA